MTVARVHIFLSTVNEEFRSYRDALRHDLTRPNVSIAVQEDFIVTGTETLDMLDDYIRQCDAVVHLVGDMTGALAQEPSLLVIRQRYPDMGKKLLPLAPFFQADAPALSYTQWEAWLALYHGKPLIIAAPEDGAPRDDQFVLNPEQRAAQQAHLRRLAEVERYPGIRFTSKARLAVDVLRSKLLEVLASAGPSVRPSNLPFLSLGTLFKGRATTLDELTRSLGPIPDSNALPVVARVVNGLGGVGKTRLAIEYAYRHAEEYTALIFVGADSAEALQRNLVALCTRGILDLPEKQVTEEVRQYEAVLRWLRKQAGWLLILDNVDTKLAAAAAEALLPQLTGGHVLLTSRLADWSASLAQVPLDVLALEAAVDFLLTCTDGKRRNQADDPVTAQRVVEELGCLALALEQAGAYIAQRRLSFDLYLAEWQSQRDKVLDWFDERLMQYPSSVAITWQTSFDQLTTPARQLLERLAWLGPDPIPESLLKVSVPGGSEQVDGFEALVQLKSYSLVTHVADRPTFNVHRLVQEITRRSQREEPQPTALVAALNWIFAAFLDDPANTSNWPVLDPLLAHARAVSAYADRVRITTPTAYLMNQAGLLLHHKSKYDEARPLYNRALAIRKMVLGPEHPDVAQSLNNLAALYHAEGNYPKAESLVRQALLIVEKVLGPKHLDVAVSLNSLGVLYQTKGRYAEAESLHKRALAIREMVLGPEHPDVALSLNNLAEVYRCQHAYTEAEQLHKRALTIREKVLGSDHLDVAQSLNNLAVLYQNQSTDAKAEPLLRRVLVIVEKTVGSVHPRAATSHNNLAGLYETQGAYAEAETHYERALWIKENILGEEHPDVATSLNNLAMLYSTQGIYEKAEPLMRRALSLLFRGLGSVHSTSRTVMQNYVGLLQEMGKTEAEIADAVRSLMPD